MEVLEIPNTERNLQWRPPNIDRFKLSVDAAFSSNGAAVGVLARSHEGKVMWMWRSPITA